MTWKELRDFLIGLGDDRRMDDRVIVYHTPTGDELPCDVMENSDTENPFISPDQLVIMAYDWGDMTRMESRGEDE